MVSSIHFCHTSLSITLRPKDWRPATLLEQIRNGDDTLQKIFQNLEESYLAETMR